MFHQTDPNASPQHLCALTNSLADRLLSLESNLTLSLKLLKFSQPVAYVYHPLDYAYLAHAAFTRKYCVSPKYPILFVGMNAGAWGMCQTGVPFGETSVVRDWFGIEVDVGKPVRECPRRPVEGFKCHRSEISGRRFWQLMWKLCGTPERFFKNCFVYNYCPVAFLRENGNNVTPNEIKVRIGR